MTKHNYTPGKAYKMRNGEKAVFVGEHPFDGDTLIFAHANGTRHCDYYNCDGSWLRDGTESSLDIIGEWPPEPKKVKGWLNIYPPAHRDLALVYCVLATKEQCDVQPNVGRRIACIPIEFTEGEGL